MKKISACLLVLACTQMAQAAVVTWELRDFTFDDDGTASGKLVYDTARNVFRTIDIRTTDGRRLKGRHYCAPAGSWGRNVESNILAFTDTSSTNDYTRAGWLRMDFRQFAQLEDAGIRLELRLDGGAESYCVDADCVSAASSASDPENCRKVTTGFLYSTHSEKDFWSYIHSIKNYLENSYDHMCKIFKHKYDKICRKLNHT